MNYLEQAFQLIRAERERQRALKASGKFLHTPDSPYIADTTKLAILTEELGEVARAINDDAPTEDLRAELTQVAAVAVAWIEGLLREQDQSTHETEQ